MQPDGWYKSKCSSESANCVEVFWRKSTRSGPYTDNCVEIAFVDSDEILVRDSKDPEGPVLKFAGPEWDAFVAGAKDGEFDLP